MHGKIIQNHSKIIQNHSKIIQNPGKIIQNHGRIIQNHGKIIQNPGKIFQNQGKIMQNHGKIIQNHSKIRVLKRFIPLISEKNFVNFEVPLALLSFFQSFILFRLPFFNHLFISHAHSPGHSLSLSTRR